MLLARLPLVPSSGQLGDKALDPAVEADVVHLHAAVGEHALSRSR